MDLHAVAAGLLEHGWTVRMTTPGASRSGAPVGLHLVVTARCARPTEYVVATSPGHQLRAWARRGHQPHRIGLVHDVEEVHDLLRRDVTEKQARRFWPVSA